MIFKKIELPYKTDALEPAISKANLENHYNINLTSYENELNKNLKNIKLSQKIHNIEDLIKNYLKTEKRLHIPIRQFGGGLINHNFFFSILKSNTKLKDKELIADINKTFGSFEQFKDKITEKALNIFGSGWTWLVIDRYNNLKIYNTYNQDNPWFLGMIPLITIDAWEHAYYLQYNEDKRKYIDNLFSIFNWNKIEEIYREEKK